MADGWLGQNAPVLGDAFVLGRLPQPTARRWLWGRFETGNDECMELEQFL